MPDDTAFQFEGILAPEVTYRVAARQLDLADQAGATLDVAVETCESDDPSGSVDVAISVSSNGPEIAAFDCQTPYAQTGEFTYEDPAAYRVATPDGTVDSPTS